MSKYIIELDDRIKLVTSVGVTENGVVYTTSDYVHNLEELNSDYEAKRYKDITLQHLEIIEARPGLFNDWLKLRGKLGGQHKVPRLSNSREHMEQLLRLNEE